MSGGAAAGEELCGGGGAVWLAARVEEFAAVCLSGRAERGSCGRWAVRFVLADAAADGGYRGTE